MTGGNLSTNTVGKLSSLKCNWLPINQTVETGTSGTLSISQSKTKSKKTFRKFSDKHHSSIKKNIEKKVPSLKFIDEMLNEVLPDSFLRFNHGKSFNQEFDQKKLSTRQKPWPTK